MKKFIFTVLLCVLCAVGAAAQGITVKGVVTDAAGSPLAGASVVSPAGDGTVTDIDGNFSINVPAGTVLTVSFVSFKSSSFTADGSVPTVTVRLQEDSEFLSEVVVVGYGVQKKANLSGSVAQIGGKELENRPITNVSQGLQGLMPGITITGSDGAPGLDGGTINIRGVGTLNSSSPYILVDGVETSNFNSLDPNDIESISVLKDASSAAIYGSKASNGVILVTTKRGTEGAPKVSYSGSGGVSTATMLMDRMNSADAATWYNKALERTGKSPRFSAEDIASFSDGKDPYGHPNTDWYALAYRPAWQTRHNVGVSGGSKWARYMASAGYLFQDGILPNSGRNQFNLRTNLDADITERLTVHANLSFIHNDYTDASSAYAGGSSDQIIRQLNRVAPWIVNRYEDGSYGTISDGNPIAWLDSGMQVKRDNRNITGTLGFDLKITDGLVFKATGSYVNNSQRYNYFQKFIQYNPNKASDPAQLTVQNTSSTRYNLDLLLDWNRSFGSHNLSALAGYHMEKYDYIYDWAFRKGFPNNDLTDMNAGDASSQKNEGYTRALSMVSAFARVNYDYAGKYLFEANFRADASSRFAPGNRWGFFPSFSAAWRITQEDWMESARSVIESLKLRASWGQLGNQDALSDYYPWMNTYNLQTGYPFDGTLIPGYYQSSYHLDSISWERSSTWGVGVDFTFRAGLSGSIDFYDRTTTGIIMDVSTPSEFGLGAYKDNVGSMRNRGVEVSLAYNRQLNQDWSINVSGNFSYNRNVILDLGEGVDYIESGSTRNAVGHQYGCYYMYKWSGKFFESDQQAAEYTAKYGNPFNIPFKAGDLVYEDADGNGKLDSNDRIYTETSSMPAITYNLTLGFGWKGLDFSMLWQGTGKVDHIFNREVLGEFSGDSGHPSTLWADSWTESNLNPKMPRVFETGTSASGMDKVMSTFWLWDTSYLRLKNLQLGYSFKFNNKAIEKLRIYYSAENLCTIHKLPFSTDPETTSERGSSYPLLRTHSFGLNITF